MKQRISIDQLKELTPSQQEKLRAWWKPQTGDFFAYETWDGEFGEGIHDEEEINSWNHADENCLPLLSIGQCIELLGENLTKIEQYYDWWEVKWWDEKSYKSCSAVKTWLIDTLWEAVKSIL